ncbi:hypothetical protein ACWDOR_42295 [Streptosporangium canum]
MREVFVVGDQQRGPRGQRGGVGEDLCGQPAAASLLELSVSVVARAGGGVHTTASSSARQS